MIRLAGVSVLLATMVAALFASNENAMSASNLIDLANRQGFNGILTLAAAIMILSGSIDLSLGSVVGLGAITFGTLMHEGVPPYPALLLTVLLGMLIGSIQGGLVYGLKLQSFLVTLCGMFIYRGIARLMTGGLGIGLQQIQADGAHPEFAGTLEGMRFIFVGIDSKERLAFPAMLIVFLLIAALFGLILHKTKHGRCWYAIGYNEQAARYAGIDVRPYRIATFVVGSGLASFAGCLLLLSYGSANPDTAGQNMELEAITGAVLGGVSLRGGEGTIVGIALGAAVLPLLNKLVTFLGIPTEVIPIVVGLTLFFGAFVDEFVRRRGAGRKG